LHSILLQGVEANPIALIIGKGSGSEKDKTPGSSCLCPQCYVALLSNIAGLLFVSLLVSVLFFFVWMFVLPHI